MTNEKFVDYHTYNGDFLNRKRKNVHCYYWEPTHKPRALLLILHGVMDHAMMYEQLALEMVKRKFFVFSHDHVGHGRSEGRRADVSSIREVTEDAIQHVNIIQKKFPKTPLFVFGHSMGGAISLILGLEHKKNLKGVVAAAPALMSNPETATPIKVAAAKLLGSILPKLPIAYADISLSCRDKVQIEKMNSDPLRFHGYFTARTVSALLGGGDEILKKKDFVDFPYLLLHGDADKVCNVKGSEILHEASKTTDKSLIIYPGAYHSLFQEPSNISSDVLWRSISWLEERS